MAQSIKPQSLKMLAVPGIVIAGGAAVYLWYRYSRRSSRRSELTLEQYLELLISRLDSGHDRSALDEVLKHPFFRSPPPPSQLSSDRLFLYLTSSYDPKNTNQENMFLILCREGWSEDLLRLFSFFTLRGLSEGSDPHLDQDSHNQEITRWVTALLLAPTNVHGCTGLHLACLNGHAAVVELLLKYIRENQEICSRILTHKTNANDWTPLHLAVAKGHEECVKLIWKEILEKVPKQRSEYTPDGLGNTPVMVASCNGYLSLLKLFWDQKIISPAKEKEGMEHRNKEGKTGLHYAVMNGHLEIIKLWLDRYLPLLLEGISEEEEEEEKEKKKEKKGEEEEEGGPRDLFKNEDRGGYTVVHAACYCRDLTILKMILSSVEKISKSPIDKEVMLDASTRSGETPLHLLCQQKNDATALEMIPIFLEAYFGNKNEGTKEKGERRLLLKKDHFGKTVIHECCRNANFAALEKIFQYLDSLPDQESIQAMQKQACETLDYDGISILHDAVSSYRKQEMEQDRMKRDAEEQEEAKQRKNTRLSEVEEDIQKKLANKKRMVITKEDILKTVTLVLAKLRTLSIDLNALLDYSNTSALYMLCFSPPRDAALGEDLMNLLLDAGADPTIEHAYGWIALHAIRNAPEEKAPYKSKIEKKIREKISDRYGEDWLKTQFSPEKTRDFSQQVMYQTRRGPANQIPEEQRKGVLKADYTLSGIASFIKSRIQSGYPVRIVMMVGAGISVSAGIPDFRSRETGIYSNSSSASLFQASALVREPERFYEMVKGMFLPIVRNQIHPTLTHHFIKLLEEHGLLLRCYTQNIDMLESRCGISEDKIVEAHGTFKSFRCMTCDKKVKDESEVAEIWNVIEKDELPRCSSCKGVMRPNVIFFGEGLSSEYADACRRDLPKCDLLIVMGTTLVVYPFAGMVNEVPLLTPRLLINREATGVFKDLVEEKKEKEEKEEENEETKRMRTGHYRDVFHASDCDEGVRLLAELLGWKDELEQKVKH